MQSIRYTTRLRRRATSFAVAIVLAVGLGACRQSIEVRTVAAPNANFVGRRTFRILPTPAPSNVSLGATDPMLTNSITYQAIHSALRSAFESRGYRYSPQGADLDVAYYATAGPVLDIRTWDYGYDWRGLPRQYTEVYQYEQGVVVVDVIDPVTHQLLWRGEGKAAVSSDPAKYADELRKAVEAIIKQFPAAR